MIFSLTLERDLSPRLRWFRFPPVRSGPTFPRRSPTLWPWGERLWFLEVKEVFCVLVFCLCDQRKFGRNFRVTDSTEEMRLDSEINHMGCQLDSEINHMGCQLDSEINHMGCQLDSEINHMGCQLDSEINHMGCQLDSEINHMGCQLDCEMNHRGCQLDSEINHMGCPLESEVDQKV